METINLTKEKFEKLEKKNFPSSVTHAESNIFLFNINEKNMVFKKLNKTSGLYFSNKLYVINSLIDNKSVIDIPELVLPEALVTVDFKAVGTIMPYIEGDNLKSILVSTNVSIEEKISYLRRIGEILEKMENVRHKTRLGLFLNDIHENNFVVNKSDVFVVDMDSATILESIPFGTRYLSYFTPLRNFPDKYDSNLSLSAGGEFKPSYDTELYCYYMIILNLLYGGRVYQMNVEEYNEYLNYLLINGADSKFIEMCSKVYSNDNNVNPKDHLDSLSKVYKRVRSK